MQVEKRDSHVGGIAEEDSERAGRSASTPTCCRIKAVESAELSTLGCIVSQRNTTQDGIVSALSRARERILITLSLAGLLVAYIALSSTNAVAVAHGASGSSATLVF